MPNQADPPGNPASRPPPRHPHAASADIPSGLSRLWQDHARALDATLARLKRHAIGTLLTLCVIGIVLSLPTALAGLLQDLSGGSYQLGQQSARTTLFLKDTVTPSAGQTLARHIAERPGVVSSRYLSRSAALAEFKQHSDAAAALDLLDENPLPASIIVTPDVHAGEAATQALMRKLASLPEVDRAQLNEQWLSKLYAIFKLTSRVIVLMMGALAITVLIVIGNTVRLEIEDRRDEIATMKLMGAPNAYVRRPFLYSGICYGVGGAILALILVAIGVQALESAAQNIARLYGATISLSGPGFGASIGLLGIGLALGWVASFWTVSRHLHKIEPR